MSKLDIFTAAMICEGTYEVETEEEVLEAWQRLVDTGVCWQLQGFYGRTAASLIEQGVIQPAGEVS
jgi:hypothetical protein